MDIRVDSGGQVKVMIYNKVGEQVEKLVDQQMTPGNYRFSWDGKNRFGEVVGSDTYFIVIQTPASKLVQKVIVLK